MLAGENLAWRPGGTGPHGSIVKVSCVALHGSCESSGSLVSVGNNGYFVRVSWEDWSVAEMPGTYSRHLIVTASILEKI